METNESLLFRIQEVLRAQQAGVLATQGLIYPYCSLVAYVSGNGGRQVIFATVRDTQKHKNLLRHPQVSLLVTTQTNQVSDFKDARALTVLGTAAEIADTARSPKLQLYLQRHPYLEEFVTAANCALVGITVAKYILVENFQTVSEYEVT